MTNYDVAHKFFYDLNGNFSKNYMNVSYSNYKYYSYYTIIGKVIEDFNGNYLLLVSENNFSNTTAKHINNLLGACPFDNYIYVPINYGDRDIDIKELENKIIKKLDYFKNSKLSLKENRDNYCHYYTILCEISHKVVKVKKSTIAKYRKLYLELQDINKVKDLKKQQRIKAKKALEKAKKDREKQEKQLKKDLECLDIKNIVDYAKMVYAKNFTTEKLKNFINSGNMARIKYIDLLKKTNKFLMDHYGNFDFVWIENDTFKTSKHVTVKIEDCKNLIRLYKSGKIKHGLKLNQYTILEVKNDFIKIGCHKICKENIDLLIKELEDNVNNYTFCTPDDIDYDVYGNIIINDDYLEF